MARLSYCNNLGSFNSSFRLAECCRSQFCYFDQPSQVYFPQRSRNSTLSEEDVQIADEDKQAVQKIFIAMDKFLHDTQKDVQIIVTEHADEDIWGDVSSSHLVERWRGSNDKLIPAEWITQG